MRLSWSLLILCYTIFLLEPLSASKNLSIAKAQKVLVVKSKRKLYLIRYGKVYRQYSISLGGNPIGAKERLNDQKTPEGHYILDFKNLNSHFYRSIHISYPTAKQKRRARREGFNAGGDIMIHGEPNGWEWLSFIWRHFDWTSGCIAVSNSDMREIWKAVDIGTPIEIKP